MRRMSFLGRVGRGRPISLVPTLALVVTAGAARADLTGSLKWSATTGAGTPGSDLIAAQAGDQLTLDVFVTPGAEGVQAYSLSVFYDEDLADELDFVSVTSFPIPGMTEIVPAELIGESDAGDSGQVGNITAEASTPEVCDPGPVSGTFKVAEIVFSVTGNVTTDDLDVRFQVHPLRDGYYTNGCVFSLAIDPATANVDRGITTAPPPPPCGVPTGSGPGTPHLLNPATDYDAVQTPRDGEFDSINQTLTTINNFSTGSSLYRSVLEFDLQGLPDGEEIRDAALTLRRVSTGGADGVDVFGFPADGVASIADASNAGVRLATNIDADFTSYLTLDGEYLRCFLQSLVETGETHAGFLLMISGEPLAGTNSRAFSSSEGVVPPVLSLTTGEPAALVPTLGPSGRGLLAALMLSAAAGVVFFRGRPVLGSGVREVAERE